MSVNISILVWTMSPSQSKLMALWAQIQYLMLSWPLLRGSWVWFLYHLIIWSPTEEQRIIVRCSKCAICYPLNNNPTSKTLDIASLQVWRLQMEKRCWYNLERKQFECSHITVKKLECYLNLVTNLICFPKQFFDLFFPNTIFLDVTSQLCTTLAVSVP